MRVKITKKTGDLLAGCEYDLNEKLAKSLIESECAIEVEKVEEEVKTDGNRKNTHSI